MFKPPTSLFFDPKVRTDHLAERMRCSSLLLLVLVILVGSISCCEIPKAAKPLCGTNGVSFVNRKALQCYNQLNPEKTARLAYKGRCLRPEIVECNYSSHSRPVCGDDKLTYLNAAMVACKNKLKPKKKVKILNKGPCIPRKKLKQQAKAISRNRTMNA